MNLTKIVLVLRNVQLRMSGTYKCEVTLKVSAKHNPLLGLKSASTYTIGNKIYTAPQSALERAATAAAVAASSSRMTSTGATVLNSNSRFGSMEVVDDPNNSGELKHPVIEGFLTYNFTVGDVLDLVCGSGPSKPAPQ